MTLQERVEELETQIAMQDETIESLVEKVYEDKPFSFKIGKFVGYATAIAALIVIVLGVIAFAAIMWTIFKVWLAV